MSLIVCTGGGTGGHIFPGLAVIEALRKREGTDVVWVGSSRGMDRSLVEGAGVRFIGVPSGKLRRYLSMENLIDMLRVVAGFFRSLWVLARLKPAVVFSKGGFVSVPPCAAARVLGVPVVTHECDLSPGLATRINARFARDVLVSAEETVGLLSARVRPRATVTGNPVRSAFYSASAERGRAFLGVHDPAAQIVFVLGGSLGARQVNDLVRGALDSFPAGCFVAHQTGSGGEPAVPGGYAPGKYRAFEFIRSEMPDVLAAATLVVGRSGANTVWECAATGTPMVLVPLEKGSSRGDQVENARFFEDRGAAIVLTGQDATAARLAEAVSDILSDRERLGRMAAAARELGSGRAAERIAEIVLSRAGGCL
jgi:UDP-N-acetylglucosamine--N-acetylmuramyl-(pentapeptide) pyrophosphoryl-undecaprenol N-acetylglucosamine transferase